MQLLAEIHEKDIFPQSKEKADFYKLRKVVNAVLINEKGEIAMLYAGANGHHYHLLPGGKIKVSEDFESTLKREVLEETGYDIEITNEIGAVILYEEKLKTINISYTFLAVAKGYKTDSVFTEAENMAGFRLQWMDLENALKVVQKDKTEDYIGSFLLARELVVIKKAKDLIAMDTNVYDKKM